MDDKRMTRIAGVIGALLACAALDDAPQMSAVQAAQAAQPLRVLLIYDMEGLNGATAPGDVIATSTTYPAARESLTAEVNAAIRGLLNAGAGEVVVTDGHGSGNAEPDYLLDQLPAGARFDLRDGPYDPYIEAPRSGFAALVAIGMHSGAGRRGFLSHTYNGHTKWVMGRHDMNESMIVAASAARFNIPLILVTGDDVLLEEVQQFTPLTQYVVVKHALSREAAAPRPRGEILPEIERAAQHALTMRDAIGAWTPTLEAPIPNDFSYQLPDQAGVAGQYPGAIPIDNKTIRLDTPDFMSAYLTFRALARFTGLVESRLIVTRLQERPDGPTILHELRSDIPVFTRGSFEATSAEVVGRFTAMGRHGYR